MQSVSWLLQFEWTMHTVLLKSKYYNTPPVTCFEPLWPIIKENKHLKNICLTFKTFK
jgi:hypothetical protein